MNGQWKINVIRSRRKTVSMEVKPDLTLVVRVPMRTSKAMVEQYIQQKSDWIEMAMAKQVARREQIGNVEPFTAEELRSLAKQAADYIPKRVEYFAERMQIDYGRITIRSQKTRWGSCSGKGNLNFNCLLMLTPPEIIDYVVVHELCHRKEMNHSRKFWSLVQAVLPDYKDRRKWLKTNGSVLIRRLPK